MTETPTQPYRRFGRETFSAVMLALFSTPALVFSVFLTVLKFRTEHRCDSFSLNTCSSGCSIALSDALSEVWGLPLTVYSTGFYAALLLASLALGAWPRVMAPLMRLPLLVLGASGLLVSIILASYAALVLETWCELCTVLYIASVGVFLATRLLNPEGLARGLFRGLRRMSLNQVIVAAVLASALLAVVLVQKRLWARYAADATLAQPQSAVSCEEHRLTALPPTPYKLPSTGAPEVVVAMFFDLACPHCKKDFEFWREYQRENAEFLQVEFFHFSGDPACGRLDSPGLKQQSSCLGALALQCLSEMQPGAEIDHMRALFAMQGGDREVPIFSPESIAALGEQRGAPTLLDCVRSREVLQQIGAHIEFGAHHGLRSPPASLIVPMAQRGWTTKPSGFAMAVHGGGKSREWVDAQIRRARERRNER